jgi:putative transposase
MERPGRAADGGLVYHVLNRANARMTIFENEQDYAAFEQVLEEAVERTGTRLLAYCVLPNHWHLVLWPQEDGELSRFVGWLTLTHTQRWHAHRHSRGTGKGSGPFSRNGPKGAPQKRVLTPFPTTT